MGSILKKVSCFIYRFNSDLSANKKGAAVNLASYTSLSNAYTTPESGYVLLNCTYSTTEYGTVDIYSSDNSLISRLSKENSINGSCVLSVYVHKGMKVVVSSRSANVIAVFYGIQA